MSTATGQQIILVTGANKGIGLEAVKQLSQRLPSATILLGSRSAKNGEDAIQKLRSSGDGQSYDNIKVVVVDIVDKTSLQSAVDHIKSTYGKLDVLLHNSGISNVDGDLLHPHVLDVNVTGAYDTIHAFLPLIPKDGLVILVSSEVGAWTMKAIEVQDGKDAKELHARLNDPSQNDWATIQAYMADWIEYSKTKETKKFPWPKLEGLQGVYTISKTFISAWTRHFAQNHPEVKVAIVCPGYCATELNNWQGPRPASAGGESVIWPIFNDFKTGHFYQDGNDLPFTSPVLGVL